QHIPVGHVEAGLRTRNRYNPFPEEINRRMAGVLATWHFAPTERAAAALRAEQVAEENIFVTGNTVVDALLMTVRRHAKAHKVGSPPSKRTAKYLDAILVDHEACEIAQKMTVRFDGGYDRLGLLGLGQKTQPGQGLEHIDFVKNARVLPPHILEMNALKRNHVCLPQSRSKQLSPTNWQQVKSFQIEPLLIEANGAAQPKCAHYAPSVHEGPGPA
ncbi:unnamed protein product, partial [marine sediment metagenome]